MNWIRNWILTIAVVIDARIISWWERKPFVWGVRECIRVIRLWEAEELENEIRRWD